MRWRKHRHPGDRWACGEPSFRRRERRACRADPPPGSPRGPRATPPHLLVEQILGLGLCQGVPVRALLDPVLPCWRIVCRGIVRGSRGLPTCRSKRPLTARLPPIRLSDCESTLGCGTPLAGPFSSVRKQREAVVGNRWRVSGNGGLSRSPYRFAKCDFFATSIGSRSIRLRLLMAEPGCPRPGRYPTKDRLVFSCALPEENARFWPNSDSRSDLHHSRFWPDRA